MSSIINVKPLKIRHIAILDDYKHNPDEFLFLSEDAESYTFYHIRTGKKITLRR